MLNLLSSVKNPNQPNIQRGIAYLPILSSLVGSISIFTKTCCQLRYSGSLAVGDFQSWTKSTNSLHVVPWIIPILVASSKQLFQRQQARQYYFADIICSPIRNCIVGYWLEGIQLRDECKFSGTIPRSSTICN